MNTSKHVSITASDVTGQRTACWLADTEQEWGTVTAQAIDILDLPVKQSGTQDPIVYHCFEETQGERLPSEQKLADVLERYRLDTQVRVRVVPELEAALRLPPPSGEGWGEGGCLEPEYSAADQ